MGKYCLRNGSQWVPNMQENVQKAKKKKPTQCHWIGYLFRLRSNGSTCCAFMYSDATETQDESHAAAMISTRLSCSKNILLMTQIGVDPAKSDPVQNVFLKPCSTFDIRNSTFDMLAKLCKFANSARRFSRLPKILSCAISICNDRCRYNRKQSKC